jgi:hypothetical protein
LVDADEKVELDDIKWEDIHVTTGALKMFFRELPEPLFTYGSFNDFVDAISKPLPHVNLLLRQLYCCPITTCCDILMARGIYNDPAYLIVYQSYLISMVRDFACVTRCVLKMAPLYRYPYLTLSRSPQNAPTTSSV